MSIIIENERFALTVGEDAIARSLICKATGEECLDLTQQMPLFSVTQPRPYNNEIKLAHPNKKMTFQANSLRREGDRLIVGFELIGYQAAVDLTVTPRYISFRLADFIVPKTAFDYLALTPPPVDEFRVMQLPVANRKYFGEWLNVAWDEKTAVNLIAASPYALIDAEKRGNCRILSADAQRGIKLRGTEAALIVCPSDELMDNIAVFEEDYDLPRGVESRRNPSINACIYRVNDLSPQNVDEHIARAKQGGFSLMLIYYPAIYKSNGYRYLGDYEYKDDYPRGLEDVAAMLQHIKDEGITPGLHFLHTHIGIWSHYVTPKADHRLHLTRNFTLSRPVSGTDTTIYVNENPEDTVMHEQCRVLKFGTELIYYNGYSTEYPYCFTGCVRGHLKTDVIPHEAGTIGGILDISEFSATSIYLDQNSDIQDEIADKLAEVCNAGFEFLYFDGSEGTNAPFNFHVPNAQYRVFKKLNKQPLFCEGAAKSHFSWHMITGGNAFDQFPMSIFKENLVRFPAEEAPRMAQDFTRLNFGWWGFFADTQPDHYDFASGIAAAWDCPGTITASLELFRKHPRTDDILEVLRRWNDVRARNLLTPEMKAELKNTAQEHTLIPDGKGGYLLVPYNEVKGAAQGAPEVQAFSFTLDGRSYAVVWHKTGSAKLCLPLADLTVEKDPGGEKLTAEYADGTAVIGLAGRCYVSTGADMDTLLDALRRAELI